MEEGIMVERRDKRYSDGGFVVDIAAVGASMIFGGIYSSDVSMKVMGSDFLAPKRMKRFERRIGRNLEGKYLGGGRD